MCDGNAAGADTLEAGIEGIIIGLVIWFLVYFFSHHWYAKRRKK